MICRQEGIAMRNLMKVVVVGAWFTASCCAQSDSVLFGGVELRLGMAKTAVLTKLGTTHNLSKLKMPSEQMDMWSLTPKGGKGEEGSVQFREEKVSNISKTLGRLDGGVPTGVLGELFYALQRGTTVKVPSKDGTDWKFTQTEVGTRDVSGVRMGDGGQEWRFRTVSFQLGERMVEIHIWEPIGSSQGRLPWVEMTERISEAGK
jgi:hypothetical protein